MKIKNDGIHHFNMYVIILQEDGFRVWIDVDQMEGSTLEAMAGAVEHAAVVLIGASEKYKMSPNCRTGTVMIPTHRSMQQ